MFASISSHIRHTYFTLNKFERCDQRKVFLGRVFENQQLKSHILFNLEMWYVSHKKILLNTESISLLSPSNPLQLLLAQPTRNQL